MSRPFLKRWPYRVLRGAADLLMHRPEEAVADFSHPSLAANDEAALWRAIAEASITMPEAQVPLPACALAAGLSTCPEAASCPDWCRSGHCRCR
ncbi:MAG: hypothetical protein FD153_1271 [Rhodospirillaceae bacterium]|nr:MAG: hypothetical protein FD153_1271 [Rhodospirillaceae bacterium]